MALRLCKEAFTPRLYDLAVFYPSVNTSQRLRNEAISKRRTRGLGWLVRPFLGAPPWFLHSTAPPSVVPYCGNAEKLSLTSKGRFWFSQTGADAEHRHTDSLPTGKTEGVSFPVKVCKPDSYRIRILEFSGLCNIANDRNRKYVTH